MGTRKHKKVRKYKHFSVLMSKLCPGILHPPAESKSEAFIMTQRSSSAQCQKVMQNVEISKQMLCSLNRFPNALGEKKTVIINKEKKKIDNEIATKRR